MDFLYFLFIEIYTKKSLNDVPASQVTADFSSIFLNYCEILVFFVFCHHQFGIDFVEQILDNTYNDNNS